LILLWYYKGVKNLEGGGYDENWQPTVAGVG
jgi:hypothetical protein